MTVPTPMTPPRAELRPERLANRARFPTDPLTRLMAGISVDEATGCWEWTKSLDGGGYGRMVTGSHVDGTRRLRKTHRLAYEEWVGPIPAGLHLDHLCRNRKCCNPEHLEPVTPRVNVLRSEAPSARYAVQTHCIRGHEFTPDNIANSSDGHRRCKECNRQRAAESKARRAK